MPQKKNQQTQAEQSERFKKAVRESIDAGELNTTEADEALDSLIRKSQTSIVPNDGDG